MLLTTVISILLSSAVPDVEIKDTLTEAYVETSVKQVLPLERLASPVSVVYLKDLEERGIDSPKRLSAIVPNLHIPDYGSSMTSSIYLRGFGSRMENPVLGLYVDDVPVLNKNAYDLEMLTEIGFCNGIENYSRVIQGRAPGTPPTTLLDYFPDDFLLFIDESHVTLPQCRAMYAGDRSRKDALVNYGFRLPSAYDNRPLKFEEFYQKYRDILGKRI